MSLGGKNSLFSTLDLIQKNVSPIPALNLVKVSTGFLLQPYCILSISLSISFAPCLQHLPPTFCFCPVISHTQDPFPISPDPARPGPTHPLIPGPAFVPLWSLYMLMWHHRSYRCIIPGLPPCLLGILQTAPGGQHGLCIFISSLPCTMLSL